MTTSPPTGIYVAGAWVEQHQRARPMIARLRAAGFHITCDWTQAEGDICSCHHHRQRHAPYTVSQAGMVQTATGCADCVCHAFNGIGVGGDSQLTHASRIQYARADLEGVLTADIVWLLSANDKGACGSWVELGAALAALDLRRAQAIEGSPVAPIIIVSGPKARRTIFTELAHMLVDTDEEALAYILNASPGGVTSLRGA